jgi:AcrR family transcriptional regulator
LASPPQPAPMKTRERILQSTLLLFNDAGERNVSTVDIANELDISPGNLYYHFKGKDDLIAELFDRYEHGMSAILAAPLQGPLGDADAGVEDNWFYLYVLLEEMYRYRFIYRNLSDILERYPALKRRFRRLLNAKRVALLAILETLSAQAVLDPGDSELQVVADNLVLLLSYWINYDHLLRDERAPAVVIHQGVLQLMTQIAPYLGSNQRDFYRQCQAIYSSLIKPGQAS